MFDSTADDDSNGESVLEGSNLNVNAVAVTRKPRSILKGKGKKQFKLSEIPAGAIAKMMASK